MAAAYLPFKRIPTARLQPVIQRWLASGRTLRDLAVRSQLSERSMGAISRAERKLVTFGVADKIITAVNPFLWHTPEADGGLADIYRSPLAYEDLSRGIPSTARRPDTRSDNKSPRDARTSGGVAPRRNP